jgi:signal transduction histidine kinase
VSETTGKRAPEASGQAPPPPHRLLALAAGRGLPRRTIRLRLTLIYGGLFLLSGAALLAITYVLVSNATPNCFSGKGPGGQTAVGCFIRSSGGPSHGPPGARETLRSGSATSTMGLSAEQGRAVNSQLQRLASDWRGNELHQLLKKSGIALAIMAGASVVLGWGVAGRVLRPLRTITSAARDISATSLDRRLALGGPDDELTELGSAFDELLGRLEAAFRAQRQFVANASHELRTPLAWQRTLVQVALADPDADAGSLRAAHERVLASGTQQERIIEALLTLSRGQAGLDRREPFDVAELARQVVLARQAEAQDRQLDVYTALAPAPAAGDARLAERLIANLVDNGLRHNAPGGHVEVVTGTRDAGSVLSVINTGPVVPVAAVDRLLQPFQRLGPDRTARGSGHGLGLSIVQAVAQAHSAALVITPQPDGGLQVEVTFPRAAAPAAAQPPVIGAARSGRLSGILGATPIGWTWRCPRPAR